MPRFPNVYSCLAVTRELDRGLHVGLVGVGRIGAFHAETLASLDGRLVGHGRRRRRRQRAERRRPPRVRHGRDGRGARRRGRRRARDRDARPPATPRCSGSRPTPACPRSARSRSRSSSRRSTPSIDEVERAGILVQVGFQRRFDAGYRAARDAVRAGRARQRCSSLRAATHDPAPPPEEYIATSGGIFRDLHIHDFDAIRFVTGEEIVEVYADGAVRETPWFARPRRRRRGRRRSPARAAARSRSSPARATTRSATTSGSRSSARRTASPSASTSARPLRSVEPGRRSRRRAGYRDFIDRFAPPTARELAAFVDDRARRRREPVRPRGGARRARRRARRRPLARRAAAGRDRGGG